MTTLGAAVTVALTGMLTPPVAAQGAEDRIYAGALAAVRRNPANAEASFQLARLAAERGDYGSAIAALERVLVLNPQLANIKLELGVLHLRAGANELGESFIREALKSPDAPPEVRQRASELLEVSEAGRQRLRFSGGVAAGLIGESNANAAPAAGTGLPGGGTILPGSAGRAGTSAWGALFGQLRYDLGAQAGHQLAVDATLYGRGYDRQRELNLMRGAVSAGIDLNLARSFGRPADLALRYELSGLSRGGERYLDEDGATAALRFATESLGQVTLSAYRFGQDFRPTTAVAANNDRDGHRAGIALGFARAMTERDALSGGLEIGNKSATVAYEAYREVAASLTYGRALPALVGNGPGWRMDLGLRVARRHYDGADPVLGAGGLLQRDTRAGISATLNIPINPKAVMQLEIGHQLNSSSYGLRDYKNSYVSMGLNRSF